MAGKRAKLITAKLIDIRPVKVPGAGPYVIREIDPNALKLVVKTIDGPIAMLDKTIVIDVGVEEFCGKLNMTTAASIQKHLNGLMLTTSEGEAQP